jgi:hypothetical protein
MGILWRAGAKGLYEPLMLLSLLPNSLHVAIDYVRKDLINELDNFLYYGQVTFMCNDMSATT